MSDTTFDTPNGASVWEEQMLHHLHDHTRAEGAILSDYADVAAHTPSKALAYVLRMLLEDEQRHHRWFQALESTLRTEAELSGDDTEIPSLDFRSVDKRELRDLIDRLVERERQDAAELKRLRRELADYEQTTLWPLVIDVMQRDTDKHMAVLRGLKRLLSVRL